MKYIFRKEYTASGYFEECMDDGFPDMGSYSCPISETFMKNQLLDTSEIENNIFKLVNSNYGVSLHGSSAFLKIPVETLLKEGILEELSEEEAEKLKKIEALKKNYYNASYETQVYQNYIEDYPDEITDATIEKFVDLILAKIHTEANYIIASIWGIK